MQTHGEAHRRKIFGGIALITAPLALGLAYLVGPATRSDATQQMEELVASGGRVEAGMILYLAALVLFVFAVFALVHLLRAERPWLGQLGGVLAVTGLLLTGVMNGAYLTLFEAAKVDIASAVTLMENLESNIVMIIIFAGAIAATVGFLVLAVGLILARTAPAWSGLLLGAGMITELIGSFASSDLIALIGIAAVFVALAPLGYVMITEPDESWESPVHFEGFFRPVGTH